MQNQDLEPRLQVAWVHRDNGITEQKMKLLHYIGFPLIMENQMERKMENEMKTGGI